MIRNGKPTLPQNDIFKTIKGLHMTGTSKGYAFMLVTYQLLSFTSTLKQDLEIHELQMERRFRLLTSP